MPRAEFEPATPATKRPQTYALDSAANEGAQGRGHVGHSVSRTCAKRRCYSAHYVGFNTRLTSNKAKALPLRATKKLGGRGGIAPTHSRPRH
jgi:hypothetical protein